MKAKDIMTHDPVCCRPGDSLIEAAKMMVSYDCGEVPVTEGEDGKNLVGVITDRDIVCRTLGRGLNPAEMSVGECMTAPAISISEETDVDECLRVMQESQIRRVPITGANGAISGIIALADITKYTSEHVAGDTLREISDDTGAPLGAALNETRKPE